MTKVNVCGVINSQMGYAALTRDFIDLLHRHQFEVSVSPIDLDKAELSYGPKYKTCLDLTLSKFKPDINIIIMIPKLFKQFKRADCINIGLTMFESDGLPDGWADECNSMDGIIVPSTFNEKTFRAAGVKVPIYVIPPAVDNSIKYADKYDIQHQMAEYKFYSIFQWSERKNPEGLIRAFSSAFSGISDVSLTLKTYGANKLNPTWVENEVKMITSKIKLKHYPKIHLETKLLSEHQMGEIHNRCDCYVSSSRGEGWNLPAYTALLNSNYLITTGWSAITDFLPPDYPGLVSYTLVPPYNMGTFAPFYNAEKMLWADPSISDLMLKMRWAYEHKEEARAMARKTKINIVRDFSEENVVEKIKESFHRILTKKE